MAKPKTPPKQTSKPVGPKQTKYPSGGKQKKTGK